MIRIKIVERETGKTVEIKEFRNEKEAEAFWFWWMRNGNIDDYYAEEINSQH